MKRILLSILSAGILFTSCTKDKEIIEAAGETQLTFDAKVGTADFALNTDFSIEGRTYRFNKLRYWISNLSLVDTKGNEYTVPNSYYLVEETAAVSVQDGDYTYPANKRESISLKSIPAGEYKTIKFSIGVDARYNDNLSLQSGELSQLNGMTNVSWMWHTSYIFTALGGTVTEGTTTKTIKAETGTNATFKSVSYNLPAAISIGSLKSTSVDFVLDVTKLFAGLDLVTTPTIGASQAAAMNTLATNYTQAITLSEAK